MKRTDTATMSTSELVATFTEQALLRGRLLDQPALSDKVNAERNSVLAELRCRGKQAMAALLPLLDSADAHVRMCAGWALMEFFPERVRPVLEALAAGRSTGTGMAGWDAYIALDLYDKGAPLYEEPAEWDDSGEAQPPLEASDAGLGVLARHLESTVGSIHTVFHPLADVIATHVDVVLVRGTTLKRWVLVTDGVRNLNTAPCELVLSLPADWPIEDDASSWVVARLQDVAALVAAGEMLGEGHVVSNGSPAQPLSDATRLCGWLLLPPFQLFRSPGDMVFNREDGDPVRLLALYALYPEELDMALHAGVDTLLASLGRAGISDLLEINRPMALVP